MTRLKRYTANKMLYVFKLATMLGQSIQIQIRRCNGILQRNKASMSYDMMAPKKFPWLENSQRKFSLRFHAKYFISHQISQSIFVRNFERICHSKKKIQNHQADLKEFLTRLNSVLETSFET